ncbi:unnamed protein product [Caenorhabditis angaria]|uniref:G-protein coupled receptors family 1 profile domain-containing protein n=1 Tax=Caenorhabditis angaria TaxID=860376 RepID=A0A9P1IV16_9PELO|nr:unnamed protein product [Caenorhabditis angaria]
MDYLAYLAAFLMLIIGIPSIIMNSLIIYVFLKEKLHRTAFNVICFTRASINLYVTFFMFILIFTVDAILLESPYSKNFEFAIISSSMSLYIMNEFTTILVAINRFIAIFAPMFYSKYCGVKVTAFLVFLIFAYRAFRTFQDLTFYIGKECYLLFSVEYLTFFPYYNENCGGSDISSTLYATIIGFLIVSVLNIAIFSKIAMFVFQNRNIDKDAKNRQRKNTVLFFQTILQDSLVVFDMVFTFKLSGLWETRIWSLISYVLVWETIYMLDGLIMLMFNEQLSLIKKQLFASFPTITKKSMHEPSRSKVSTLPEVSG